MWRPSKPATIAAGCAFVVHYAWADTDATANAKISDVPQPPVAAFALGSTAANATTVASYGYDTITDNELPRVPPVESSLMVQAEATGAAGSQPGPTEGATGTQSQAGPGASGNADRTHIATDRTLIPTERTLIPTERTGIKR